MKPVNQIRINSKNINEVIDLMKDTGFNGKKLARACQTYDKMIKHEGCVKFFGLSGAMVPAGMRTIIRDWINNDYIDVLVTTGANITHDVAEALGHHHLQGASNVNDKELRKKDIDRIYDVFMKNEVYEDMEDFVKALEIKDKISVKEVLWLIGKELNDPESILTTAAKKQVPVFCPGFIDCGLAVQVALNHQKIVLDYFKDLRELINTAWDASPAGFVIIGGGVPKNHIMQALQFTPNNASYAVQVTTDIPSPGGLSGAELREGISWGKVNPEAEFVSVLCDATIALPIMASYLG